MESLFYGALIFGVFLALLLIGLPIARSVEKRTGRHILDWFEIFLAFLFCIILSALGLVLVYWGAQINSVILVVIGFSITAWFGWLVLSAFIGK